MAVFLGEDGVLSLGNKTPVTILQETLQKQGITPHYDLIYNGTGTLNPVFKYQVSAIGLTAIGDGKTKKEAKHDAAAAFLKRMQVKNALTESENVRVIEEVDVASPYAGALKQNYVGTLDDLCFINQIPYADFHPVAEEGPPHARIFTMQCKVGNLKETAVARTKKQAKHLSSQKMIKKLTEILGDLLIPLPESPHDNEYDEEDSKNLKAIEAGSCNKLDFAMKFSDMHNAFFQRIEENPLPKGFEELSLQSEEYYEKLQNPKEFLDNLVQELEGKCKVVYIPRKDWKAALKELDKLLSDDECSDEEQQHEISNEDELLCKKHVFKEFELDSSDNENSTVPEDFTATVSKSSSRQVEEAASLHSSIKNLTFSDKEENLSNPREGHEVVVQVICPQGTWAFPKFSENSKEEALNEAAVKAIKFLRLMSVPSKKFISKEVLRPKLTTNHQ